MREIGRIAQGFYPTHDRIVQLLSRIVTPPASGLVTVLDAGCGEGKALVDLRDAWASRHPAPQVRLYGVESDKGRAKTAQERFADAGGAVLWSPIEDCDTSVGVSLLWFNPPYDRIRGYDRMETALFRCVNEWPARGGHLLAIVPDYVLADERAGLACAIARHYEPPHIFRYPDPEYKDFKQCVLIAARRERALDRNRVDFPAWAYDSRKWPRLPEDPKALVTLRPAIAPLRFRRTKLGQALVIDILGRSPLRGMLLREAMAPAPTVEKPLMPLKKGHLALALAGGLCDGIVEAHGERFLVKGSLTSVVRKTGEKEKKNEDGEIVQRTDIMRTVYEMRVRCLRDSGRIENYSSHGDEDDVVTAADEQFEEVAAE